MAGPYDTSPATAAGSGRRVYKAIAPKGKLVRSSSHLRAVLSEAAWTAVKRVPVYEALFERVAGRRGKQVAIVAVARRMLEDAVRMLWKGEAFRFVPVIRDAAKTVPQINGTACSDPSIPAVRTARIEIASSVAG